MQDGATHSRLGLATSIILIKTISYRHAQKSSNTMLTSLTETLSLGECRLCHIDI